MINLATDIRDTVVNKGVAVWWLAQAGFSFKSQAGKVIYLDAYLTDSVERLCGLQRLAVSPIEPDDVQADVVMSSHKHEDHLDVDAAPVINANNPECLFAGPKSCKSIYDDCGIASNLQVIMEPGKRYNFGDVSVYTAQADHGEMEPDALSFLFDFNGTSVLFTGDTCLRPDLIKPLADMKPDVLIPCINGAFGNLDAQAAAELTAIIRPKLAVPCHFWMFAIQRGDPQAYIDACAKLCPDVKVMTMNPGHKYSIE